MARTPKASAPSNAVSIPRFDIRNIRIRLVSDSPLISHNFAEKQKKQMNDRHMMLPEAPKEPKNPEQEYLDSLYNFPGGGYGIKTLALKAAAVDACSYVKGITKVAARGTFHIDGDLLKLEGKPQRREDPVRLPSGAEIRYRGEFTKWAVDVPLRYNASVLSREQIVQLFDIAGFAVGVGDWRPQKDGSFGMFHVARGNE